MLNNKPVILLVAAAMLLLTSCTEQQTIQADIIDIATIGSSDVKYNTVMCVLDDVYREVSTQASIVYPVAMQMKYDGEGTGRVKEIYVYNNELVEKGTVLAEIYYDQTQLEADRDKIRLNIENSEIAFHQEKERRQADIASMTYDLQNMTRQGDAGELGSVENMIKLQRLKIEKAQCDYEYLLYTSQKKIDELLDEVNIIDEKLAGYKIIAPFEGTIANIVMYSNGDVVNPGDMFMNIFDRSTYKLRITADPTAFRYNNDVNIEINNDAVYPGRVVSDPTAKSSDSSSQQFYVEFIDQPANFSRMTGRRFMVSGRTNEVWDVPTVPFRAVRNEDSRRYVLIMENNVAKKRYVKLGLNNFDKAEVLSGVKLGDNILE